MADYKLTPNMQAAIRKETTGEAYPRVYLHADDSVTVITTDDDCPNPRDDWDHFAVLVQLGDGISLDTPDSNLAYSWNHFGFNESLFERYVSMLKPDIAYLADYWSAGRYSHGWGYVTVESLVAAGHSPDNTEAARQIFENEVNEFRSWCDGDVYRATNLRYAEPVVTYGEHGAYVDDYVIDDSYSCGCFIGFSDDIAASMSASPVVCELDENEYSDE